MYVYICICICLPYLLPNLLPFEGCLSAVLPDRATGVHYPT